MLYTIFMRKIYGDHSPFAVSVTLNSYFKIFGDKSDIVIAFPGYMSKTQINIDTFVNSIDFPSNTYFTVGMNGDQAVKPPSGTKSIQDVHNTHKKFSFTVNGLKNTNEDHAKMIFILNNPKYVNCVKASELLDLDVKAVLIGSSNQSLLTYFNKTADKGEADLFLINSKYLKNANNPVKQDDEILQFYNFIKYKEIKETKKGDNEPFKNIALFKELSSETTLNLNAMFKESIQGLIE